MRIEACEKRENFFLLKSKLKTAGQCRMSGNPNISLR